jgi:MFS family permease
MGMAVIAEPGKREEWQAHWTVITPCFLGMMLIAAHSHSLGVMIGPLEREFGWPRAQISAGGLIISLMALLGAPLVGRAVDRFGARRIALFGVLFYCAMLSTLSLASASIASWWGLWVLVALGSMGILPVVWLAAVNGFFRKNRGMAMAIAMSGSGLGAAVWPFLTNTLVDTLGWRLAYVGLAIISATVIYPVVYFFLRDAVRNPSSDSAPVAATGLPPPRRIWMTPRFFKLLAASFVFAMAGYALSNNLVPVLIGEGLTPGSAAATVSLLGLGVIVGRLLGGYLLDNMNGNIVAAACVLQIVPVLILLSTTGSQAWAAFSCLLIGLSVGTELDASAYLAARHFGARNFGSVFGVINGTLLFSAGVAPMAANYVYDVTLSYDYVLIALIPLLIASAILFLILGDYSQIDEETGQPLAA